MKYMGSKSKVARYIVPIIQKHIDDSKPWAYIEPFCGGCNIIDKVYAQKRFAHDKQEHLIELFKNLDRLGELPEFITKKHYSEVRNCFYEESGVFEKWYVGAIGYLASYNGRFFDGGYAGVVETAYGVRNYYAEALKNIKHQAKYLKEVEFVCSDYKLIDTQKAVIYCDPPYKGTKEYRVSNGFDYEKFWQWVRRMSAENVVLVSSNEAPEDFKCIWEKPVSRTIASKNTVQAVEKLFILEGEKTWKN